MVFVFLDGNKMYLWDFLFMIFVFEYERHDLVTSMLLLFSCWICEK